MQQFDLSTQHTMQQMCNIDIKAIALQRLRKIKSATSKATTMQKRCCTGSAQGNISDAILVTTGKKSWESKDKLLIEWFQNEKNLPKEPFQLKPSVQVIEPQKFYQGLHLDIERGNRNERSMFGALQDDLRCLKRICEKNEFK